MDLIRHQSNGAKGLRIAASVLVVIGWLCLIFCIIGGFAADDVPFIVPVLCGIVGLGVCYLSACLVRGFASIVEAAQLYWDRNAPVEIDE